MPTLEREERGKIIVFDEDEDTRDIASAAIRASGFEVQTFARPDLAYHNLIGDVVAVVTSLETKERNRRGAHQLLKKAVELELPVALLATAPNIAPLLQDGIVDRVLQSNTPLTLEPELHEWLSEQRQATPGVNLPDVAQA